MFDLTSVNTYFASSLIASGGLDKSVMIWDVGTGQCRLKLRGHVARVTCLTFSEDGALVISGSMDGSLRCWDLRSRRNEPVQVTSLSGRIKSCLYFIALNRYLGLYLFARIVVHLTPSGAVN